MAGRPQGLDERLAALSPEKRRLLERRLEREALRHAPAAAATGSPAASASAAADAAAGLAPPPPPRPLDFSLFFFSSGGTGAAGGAEAAAEGRAAGRYDLLLAAARAADRAGFAAVWTPERHFVEFGGLYPNPAVLGAALAMATERLEIRAGSVVLPLHHPVRVAEEWAVVDNLSGGRAAISCASGWHPSDFALRPETSYEERKEVMYRELETVRRLWRGETVTVTGGDGEPYEVRTRPRPVRSELPVWVTTAGSVETWRRAGAVGANLLAAMSSQPLPDLERKVGVYREARAAAGHDPAAGVVTLMLHTHVGDDLEEVKRRVREPMTTYLRSYMQQRDNYLQIPGITEGDKEALLPLAFEHYVSSASLLGTPETALAMLARVGAVGVDEVACLVDFGLPSAEVLAGLERLTAVVDRHRARVAAARGGEAVGGEALGCVAAGGTS